MRITLYMLREEADFSESAIRGAGSFTEVSVSAPDGDAEWRLFVRRGQSKPAKWADSIRPIVTNQDDLAGLRNQSSAGVLLVNAAGRVFALTFGYGYHALEPKFIEAGFGLRVAANVIGSDQVTSADTKGFNRSSRSQKTVLPAANEMYALGIEPSEEWVRQLGGKVEEKDFASTAAGADSLQLSIKDFSLERLPEKLEQIKQKYDATDYQENFGFLDNFIRMDKKDPVVEKLDGMVEAMLQNQDHDLGFAAPDPFEQLKVDHYTVKYRKSVVLEEMSADDLYSALAELSVKVDLSGKVKIEAYDDAGDAVDKVYTLHEYVQAEVNHDGHRYALTSGSWFRIDRDYLKEIDDFVHGVDDLTVALALPDWDKTALDEDENDKTAEGSYNKNLADSARYELLDKKDLHFGGYRKIEICDVLTPRKELLCVKRASQSSTLSHLFAQGSVSATLMNEPRYQKKLMKHLGKIDSKPNYGSAADWTFVYAIATEKTGALADSLFFFSRVNLVTHTREIQSRGFKVAVAKIRMV